MDPQRSSLPADVVEHVLSFLPIPTICKMRVVCKEWNELTNNATFHALCDENGKKEDYLFLWRKDNYLTVDHRSVSPKFGATFYVFDLHMERWYSIPKTQVKRTCAPGLFDEMGEWFLSMDNGVVCEALPIYGSELEERTLSLAVLNPIAKTSIELPSLDLHFPLPFDVNIDPTLVTVVDLVTHSCKVFFFNTLKDKPLAYVVELGTPNWQPVGGLPHQTDDTIAFQNNVFAALTKGTLSEHCFQLRLFHYQLEGNTFTKVWQMNFQRTIVYSKLVVRHNRLFVLVITKLPRAIPLSDSEDDLESETCFSTCQDEEGALFEMYEFLLDERTAKPIVQFTENALRAIYGDDICSHFWLAFPCLDSKGGYSSVVLIQHHSGEMWRFHLATRVVDVLPACPLSSTIPNMENVISSFDAKTMPLSLRDVLKHAPPTV